MRKSTSSYSYRISRRLGPEFGTNCSGASFGPAPRNVLSTPGYPGVCSGLGLEMYCLKRAVPVPAPLLRMRLEMHCLKRAVLVPVLAVWLEMHCLNRAALVPLLGVGLEVYCLNAAVLVARALLAVENSV